MKKGRKVWILWGCLTAVLIAAILIVCIRMFRKEAEDRAETERQLEHMAANTEGDDESASSGTEILLDGEKVSSIPVTGGPGETTRVIVQIDDYRIADLPFGEEHTLQIIQPAGRNTVRITAESVYMEDADCHGRDCVGMGEITRDNLETRVYREFIICKPHRVIVEVREP